MNGVCMRRWRGGRVAAWIAIALLAGFAPLPSTAKDAEPAFLKNLFAPELVMQSQRAIGLRAEQRKAITTAIQKTQAETIELQWSMQEAVSQLETEIGRDEIDEKAALTAASKMFELEVRVKRAHLGLLIQIRNQLDPEQRRRLRRLREGDD